jgi:phosphatidylglycerophosphatase A
MTKSSTPVHFDWRRPHHWLAFGFGSGLLPKAPGSWGTLIGIPFFLLLAPLPLAGYLLATLALFGVGVWACGKAGRELGVHDHPAIVWDEVVGYLVTMTAIPADWQWLLAGFLLFRLFDILKPWPVRWLDRKVAGGVGVMVDDVAAGLMAWAVLQVALSF